MKWLLIVIASVGVVACVAGIATIGNDHFNINASFGDTTQLRR